MVKLLWHASPYTGGGLGTKCFDNPEDAEEASEKLEEVSHNGVLNGQLVRQTEVLGLPKPTLVGVMRFIVNYRCD